MWEFLTSLIVSPVHCTSARLNAVNNGAVVRFSNPISLWFVGLWQKNSRNPVNVLFYNFPRHFNNNLRVISWSEVDLKWKILESRFILKKKDKWKKRRKKSVHWNQDSPKLARKAYPYCNSRLTQCTHPAITRPNKSPRLNITKPQTGMKSSSVTKQ